MQGARKDSLHIGGKGGLNSSLMGDLLRSELTHLKALKEEKTIFLGDRAEGDSHRRQEGFRETLSLHQECSIEKGRASMSRPKRLAPEKKMYRLGEKRKERITAVYLRGFGAKSAVPIKKSCWKGKTGTRRRARRNAR